MVIASAEGLGAVLARVRALRIAVVAGVAVALGIVLVALFVPSARADAGTGTIQFTLKNVTGGGAPYGGCVEVYDVAQLKVAEDCTGYGDYSVTGLPDGSYRVKFTGFIDKAATQWYGPAADFAHATVIVIASGSAFSASATVLDPYSLAGRVVDSSGNPFTSGFVEVWGHDYDYDSYFPTRLVYTAEVGPDGWWATPGVGSCGTCQIHYRGFAGQANTWRIAYPAYDAPTSSLVVLNATPGHFSGTIAVPTNFVGPSACVVLLTSEPGYGSWVEDTYCGAVGSPLAFDHVPPGRPYTVCVADTSGPTATCPNATSLWDFVGPGPTSTGTFTVAAGATVNIPLAFGGTVTSTPTLAGGGTPSGG